MSLPLPSRPSSPLLTSSQPILLPASTAAATKVAAILALKPPPPPRGPCFLSLFSTRQRSGREAFPPAARLLKFAHTMCRVGLGWYFGSGFYRRKEAHLIYFFACIPAITNPAKTCALAPPPAPLAIAIAVLIALVGLVNTAALNWQRRSFRGPSSPASPRRVLPTRKQSEQPFSGSSSGLPSRRTTSLNGHAQATLVPWRVPRNHTALHPHAKCLVHLENPACVSNLVSR